ncbi:MAG: hypothetical protein LUD72_06985 [Bacteroidales bacterium]|nr:hypothetical protein [Bacteroidales bacterium]
MESILKTQRDECYLCGCHCNAQLHHIYPGNPRRRFSTEDGMVVYLCPKCHELAHNNRPDMLKHLQRLGQYAWEKQYGSRGDFIRRYGKNYILEEK